ncbi:hypothetical protein FB45DRAFT_868164 [Roridomyces roridus]|uniref:Uncharacterized protein n=1 Tax=Roridomyces roridus TaxID=1738132 RepID=A0AAD7BPG4_9AGAR|nr:hypothetical protein FB45DRAFT_868164 [Roridomyces roridus]
MTESTDTPCYRCRTNGLVCEYIPTKKQAAARSKRPRSNASSAGERAELGPFHNPNIGQHGGGVSTVSPPGSSLPDPEAGPLYRPPYQRSLITSSFNPIPATTPAHELVQAAAPLFRSSYPMQPIGSGVEQSFNPPLLDESQPVYQPRLNTPPPGVPMFDAFPAEYPSSFYNDPEHALNRPTEQVGNLFWRSPEPSNTSKVRLDSVYSKQTLTAVNFGAATGFKAHRQHRRDSSHLFWNLTSGSSWQPTADTIFRPRACECVVVNGESENGGQCTAKIDVPNGVGTSCTTVDNDPDDGPYPGFRVLNGLSSVRHGLGDPQRVTVTGTCEYGGYPQQPVGTTQIPPQMRSLQNLPRVPRVTGDPPTRRQTRTRTRDDGYGPSRKYPRETRDDQASASGAHCDYFSSCSDTIDGPHQLANIWTTVELSPKSKTSHTSDHPSGRVPVEVSAPESNVRESRSLQPSLETKIVSRSSFHGIDEFAPLSRCTDSVKSNPMRRRKFTYTWTINCKTAAHELMWEFFQVRCSGCDFRRLSLRSASANEVDYLVTVRLELQPGSHGVQMMGNVGVVQKVGALCANSAGVYTILESTLEARPRVERPRRRRVGQSY